MSLPVAILAGGIASRLRPLTRHVPKSLLEVAGKPFIVHQLECLRRNQIDRIVLCVGHLGEKIRETLGDGSHFRLRIDYVFDGPDLLGTGGGVDKPLPLLGDAFFVLSGDSFLQIDYQAVRMAFGQKGKLGLMDLYSNTRRMEQSNSLAADR